MASSSCKRVRIDTTIPLAPSVPRGQTQRYGAKTIISKGRKWYKYHTETKYFSDVVLEDVNLEMEFPHIRHHFLKLHLGFVFQEPVQCQHSEGILRQLEN